MRALDADREAALTHEASAFPHRHEAGAPTRHAGVGPITATALAAEVFHRGFRSRTSKGEDYWVPEGASR
jgi:transposase